MITVIAGLTGPELAPRYRKIDGRWYVLKSHMAEQMEKVMLMAQINTVREMVERTDVENRYLVKKHVDDGKQFDGVLEIYHKDGSTFRKPVLAGRIIGE